MKNNEEQKNFIKAIFLGTLGAFFFAFNFVLIRSMNLSGGFFLWTACLRYFFTLPLIAILLIKGNGFKDVFNAIRHNPISWIVWSTVGFGLFYAPVTAASIYGESWFTAAVWQFTIVAGILLTPLFGKRIPFKNLICACIIVIGIFLMQFSKIKMGVEANWIMLIITMGIGAFSYPLGNRKMMIIAKDNNLSTIQRIFGMTFCSMPFWGICAIIACVKAGVPSLNQCLQSFWLALLAGVIATILFFSATDIVKQNPKQLAVVEATQSGEVIFTVLLGVLWLKDGLPDSMGFVGIAIIIIGMVLNSLLV